MHQITEAHPNIFPRWEYHSSLNDPERLRECNVRIQYRPGQPIKERRVTALYNICGGLELGIYDNSINEGLGGLMERVFYVNSGNGEWQRPPVPEGGFFKSGLKKSVLGSFFYPVHQLTVDEFLARYKGSKLACYQRARVELDTYGFDRRKHTFVGAFVKDERQLRGKAPRLIRPFSPVFNLMFGTFVYPLEKCIYSAIDRLYNGPTVTKGLNGLQVAAAMRAKWDSFLDPICIVTDMSRFDQHCSADALDWVCKICCIALYKSGADVALFKSLWKLTTNTRGAVLCDDGIINYSVSGTLNSGLSSTSLVGVTLVCYLLRAYCLYADVKHQLISAGDDTNIIIERDQLDKMGGLSAFCLRAGFTVKIEGIADEFEHIDFCQCRPVFDGDVWVMVRDPGVVTTKDLITSKKLDTVGDILSHVKAIGDCGISLAGGIPVLDSFYRMMLRHGGDRRVKELERNGFYYMSQGMSRKGREITDAARISFYKAFGINIWRQQVLEQYYDQVEYDSRRGVERVESIPISNNLRYAFQREE